MALSPHRLKKSTPPPKAKALQQWGEAGVTTQVPKPPQSSRRCTPVSPGKQLKSRRGGSAAGAQEAGPAGPPLLRARRAVSPAPPKPPSSLANCGNSQVETRAHPRDAAELRRLRRGATPGAAGHSLPPRGLDDPRMEPHAGRQANARPPTRSSSGDAGWKGPQGAETRRAGWAPGPAEREAGMGGGSPETRRPEGAAGEGPRRAGGGGYLPHAPKRRAERSGRAHSPPPYTPPLMAAVGAAPPRKAPGRRDCAGGDRGS